MLFRQGATGTYLFTGSGEGGLFHVKQSTKKLAMVDCTARGAFHVKQQFG